MCDDFMDIEEMDEYTCDGCENVFYVDALDLPHEITDPKFCPFCGLQFEAVISEEY